MFCKAREQGIAYIEILVSMAIISMAIAGASSIFLAGVKGNKYGTNMSVALTLAQDGIEVIKNTNYNDISGYTENYGAIAVYPNFKRVVTVTNDSPDSNMKSIIVTVNWQGTEREHSVTLRTILARR